MMSQSLYQIREEYRAWVEKIVEAEGEFTPELEAELNQINVSFEEKAEAYAVIIKEQTALETAIAVEENQLANRKFQSKRLSERLKQYLSEAMMEMRLDKFETPKCQIGFRKSRSVEIDDESQIPEEYMKIKTERSPMKKELGEALKSGADISGCHLEERRNLQVR